MKATGIVRRIDDLGRVVIPKEIRRTLRIREGDPLEIFTDREGEIILKKYSPIGELATFAKEYAETLAKTVGHITCVVDKDHIIAVAGGTKKEFMDKNVSAEFEKLINNRNVLASSRSESSFVPILEDEDENDNPSYNYELIAPIIAEGDVLGAVVLLSPDKKMGEVEDKLAKTAADFLGKQMEQ
ncbi:MAG: stage V sporulation protein T [Defluviitaleaceae bacterium]|nr:stage V sporulation protein T [Defluviitaleaceae bacterium]